MSAENWKPSCHVVIPGHEAIFTGCKECDGKAYTSTDKWVGDVNYGTITACPTCRGLGGSVSYEPIAGSAERPSDWDWALNIVKRYYG